MKTARSWKEWRHAFAAKKLRQSKINLSRQLPVVNAKNHHDVLPSTQGFIQSALTDGFCKLLGTSINNSTKIPMMGQNINYLDTLPTGNWLDGAGGFWGKK